MYGSKFINDRRISRVDCTLMPNGKYTSIEDCQALCGQPLPPGDLTYGCVVCV